MNKFSITEAPSFKFVELALKKMGRDINDVKHTVHPQEDFLCVSTKYPIFVVADGVTLIQYILDKKEYPNPSPAGEASRIFCETFTKVAEERYDSFKETDLKEIFNIANEAVGEYNKQQGRTKETVDYWDIDFYAATVAFVIYKDEKIYWGSVCDSYVVHFDQSGVLKFRSPECHALAQARPPQFTGDKFDQKAKARYVWSTTRNGLNEKGERIGYGVVTGEPEAMGYLSTGIITLEKGDVVGILTDGFEEFIKLPEFISLFTTRSTDIESSVKTFTALKAESDPDKYGRERSLIILSSIV